MNQPLTNGAQFARIEELLSNFRDARKQIAADAIGREIEGMRRLADGLRDVIGDRLVALINAKCKTIEDAMRFLEPRSAKSAADEWAASTMDDETRKHYFG